MRKPFGIFFQRAFIWSKMMKYYMFNLLGALMVAGISTTTAYAQPQALTNLQSYSGVNPIQTSCSTCHSTVPALNAFGLRFLNLGGSKPNYTLSAAAQTTLLQEDTDGDGTNNLAELQAGTNPAGAGGSVTKGTATTTGCISNTLNIMALLSFLLLAMLTFASRKKVQELGE
jgi:hypothetical protein